MEHGHHGARARVDEKVAGRPAGGLQPDEVDESSAALLDALGDHGAPDAGECRAARGDGADASLGEEAGARLRDRIRSRWRSAAGLGGSTDGQGEDRPENQTADARHG
jgi:hypothetical protein